MPRPLITRIPEFKLMWKNTSSTWWMRPQISSTFMVFFLCVEPFFVLGSFFHSIFFLNSAYITRVMCFSSVMLPFAADWFPRSTLRLREGLRAAIPSRARLSRVVGAVSATRPPCLVPRGIRSRRGISLRRGRELERRSQWATSLKRTWERKQSILYNKILILIEFNSIFILYLYWCKKRRGKEEGGWEGGRKGDEDRDG